MANLIPSDVVSDFTQAVEDHFETFARRLVVFKEPIATYTPATGDVYAGFEQPTQTEVTYTPVTGVFPALKVIPKQNTSDTLIPETQAAIFNTTLRIKVKPEAMTFITQGKTEALVFAEVTYNVASAPIPVDYLGLQYYYFDLKRTT